LAVLGLVLYRQTNKLGWCIVSGFIIGWGIALRPSMIILLLPAGAYVGWAGVRRWQADRARRAGSGAFIAALRPLAALGLAIVPWAVVIGWYNLTRTGELLGFGYPRTAFPPTFHPLHILTALLGFTLSPGRSFFISTPIAVLAGWGIKPLWRRWPAECIALGAFGLVVLAFFVTVPEWLGMWEWGSRYLLIITPLLMVPVAFAIKRLWAYRSGRRLVVCLAVISLIVQLLAIVVPYGTYLQHVNEGQAKWGRTIWNPRYFPITGQIHTLQRVSFGQLPISALQEGMIPEEVKTNLRYSLDFWFVYAYRLGLPTVLWLVPLLVLVAGAVVAARRLREMLHK